jgi:hypothetical protein
MPPPHRPITAKIGVPPAPPAPVAVKPSTRFATAKTPASAPPPPPPAKPAAKPVTSRVVRPRPPVPVEVDEDEVDDVDLQQVRGKRGGGNRHLILIIGGFGLALVAIIALAMAWKPMQRSNQLAALDACRAPERAEEAHRLALAFAQEWGPRSEHVVAAIISGRGSFEARLDLCRAGGHLHLLAQMLGDDKLTPAQRGLGCAALSEMWPEDGGGPDAPPSLPAWALAPEADPALAGPALRLLVAIAAPDTDAHLARAAADGRISAERAVAAAIALCSVIDKRGGGVSALVTALDGPHRATLLALAPITACVRNNATPADTAKLVALFDKPDSLALGLAGLGGKRFQLSDGDSKARAELLAQIAPFLVPTADDALLAGALQVVHHHRLIGARNRVIALLPRLAKRRPAQLSKDDLVDLLGKSLVSARTPESAAAAEEVVTALADALDKADTRSLAIVALSRVQEQNVAALRSALDGLAGYGEDGAAALDILVGKVYDREDLVQASKSKGWSKILSEDRRKRARYDAIGRWLAEHAEETTARSEGAVIAANKAELGRMRDEVRGWLEAKDPLPIGIAKAKVDELANRVQLMLNMVIKATHM